LVTPAYAGVQNMLKILDTGLRRYDGKFDFSTFYDFINFDEGKMMHAEVSASCRLLYALSATDTS